MTHVLIAFSDAGLGGTSRSAILSARAWRNLGYRADFLTPDTIPVERRIALDQLGTRVAATQLAELDDVEFIHLHHGGLTQDTLSTVHTLRQWQDTLSSPATLITTNVFAIPDPWLGQWPGERVTTVLGRWAALQYTAAMRMRGSKYRAQRIYVLANPQDHAFFRPPGTVERKTARAGLAQCSGPKVLRLGTPHAAKWSPSYQALARAVAQESGHVTLYGAPEELARRLADCDSVEAHPMTAEESTIRTTYWSADVYASNALKGESFGNAIVEALLCGTPVVYRARPTRDNTPHEFQNFSGFFYTRSDREWVNTTLEVGRMQVRVDSASVAAAYGLDTYTQRLSSVISGGVAGRWTGKTPWRAEVWLRHNPAAAQARNIRSLRSSR